MPNIKYDDSGFQKRISKLINNMKNMTPVFREIGKASESGITRNFDSQKDSRGTRWKPLKESTLNTRAKGKGKRKPLILVDKGNLRRINSNPRRDGVEVGTSVEYGAVHNYGHNKTPKREWLYVSKPLRQTIMRIMNKYMEKSVK